MHQAIILITKTPGRLPVKTRLAADLETEAAVELYRCFLRDIGAKFRAMNLPLLVHHLPGEPDEIPVLSELLGPAEGFYPQQGDELGTRMQRAFVDGFAAGWQQLVLIGGDCPDLPPETFIQAFTALETQDCVLGPTRDGGYYLIGFRRAGFVPAVFDFPDWGAVTVYGETLLRLNHSGAAYLELEPREDVDTLAEMSSLYQQNQSGWFADSATMQAIRRLWPDAAS